MESIDIWTERYERNENSGAGSRGILGEFKINFLNNFININSIKSVIDFGCGDCYIASNIIVDNYTGIDISDYYFNTFNFKSKHKTLIKTKFDSIPEDINLKYDLVIYFKG